ncbi:potassium channel subfamily K member 16 [Nephila pilipes]|uniref:Potassium channel subfamily K member 16 n=1 Tax=Nephila pilipes TaxID=299642 RepID=A0A8X6TPA9_NEPPI|nr:potassium channel subfamily K member 16 [Nephila pilipes]
MFINCRILFLGYGDISPVTVYGQMVCILYGVIGIPINILFYKILGSSYADAYQGTRELVGGDKKSKLRGYAGCMIFYVLCIFVFFLIPASIFMLTDNWTFLEGVYYSFITLATIGLGDYVSGQTIARDDYYFAYKIVILIWMIHGIAFFSMMMDSLSRVCKRFCLFSVTCNWKTKRVQIFRVFVDIEKLDLHFRLLKNVEAKNKEVIYHFKGKCVRIKDYKQKHLKRLEEITNTLRGLIYEELKRRESKRFDDPLPFKENDEKEEKRIHAPIRFSRDVNSFSFK